ncbi:MAG: nicotinamide-nucleotide amidohydrolase family protein [Clostridia bacterium]
MIKYNRLIARMFGLSKSEIEEKLARANFDVKRFEIDEECLDASLSILQDGPIEKGIIDICQKAYKLFSAQAYTLNQNTPLEEVVVDLLKKNNYVLSVAESITGGLVAATLINVSGISENFYEGIVAYDNTAKINRLQVNIDTILNFNVVSEEIASEMANGLLKEGNIDIAISTTGIAGPTGGHEQFPVGLVCFGLAAKQKTFTTKQIFSGTRNEIRKKAANYAIFYLFLYLSGKLK